MDKPITSLLFLVKTQKRLHLTCKQTQKDRRKLNLNILKEGGVYLKSLRVTTMIYLCSFLVEGMYDTFLTLTLPAVVIYRVASKIKTCKNYEMNNRTIYVIIISEVLYGFGVDISISPYRTPNWNVKKK